MNNLHIPSTVLLAASLLLSTASAQTGGKPPFSGLVPTATFPSDHAPDLTAGKEKLVDGAAFTQNWPLAAGKSRVMCVYEAVDVKIPNGKTITHVGFQGDGTRKSVGYKVQLKIYMGKTNFTAKTASATFAKNYLATTRTQVFGGTTGGVVDLPDLGNSLSPGVDRPFVWIKLDSAYTYDSSKNLVIEYEVLSNSNSSKAFPYYLDVGRLISPVETAGVGCIDSGKNTPVLRSRPTSVDGTWRLDLNNAPGNSNAIMVFSLAKATTPMIYNGRSDCLIHLDLGAANFVPFLFFNKTSTNGYCSWSFTVPDDPALLNDLDIYSQVHVDDFFAKAQLTLSNADHVQIGMDPRMTVIVANSTTATSGYAYRKYGLISHFMHK